MFDYYDFKRDTLNAVRNFGDAATAPHRIAWLSADQRARLNGRNFVTDERWLCRLLANRSILVEISYGWMMGAPLIGLTVFHRDEDSRAWDCERSKCCHSIAELADALYTLDAGREVEA